jgi:uncharacterized protein YndB with AHSA1/START domain
MEKFMTAQPILHGSFTVNSRIAALPEKVFAAYSDLTLRQRWFRIPGKSGTDHHELDFRVGGGEVLRGRFAPAGTTEHIECRSRFLDIIASERIVNTFELLIDDRRHSVSLVSIELAPDTGGTLLTLIEQYAFLIYTGDGHDDMAERKGGAQFQLNSLRAVLEPAKAE